MTWEFFEGLVLGVFFGGDTLGTKAEGLLYFSAIDDKELPGFLVTNFILQSALDWWFGDRNICAPISTSANIKIGEQLFGHIWTGVVKECWRVSKLSLCSPIFLVPGAAFFLFFADTRLAELFKTPWAVVHATTMISRQAQAQAAQASMAHPWLYHFGRVLCLRSTSWPDPGLCLWGAGQLLRFSWRIIRTSHVYPLVN